MNNDLTLNLINQSKPGNIDWGPIEIISEPILGQNNNDNESLNPKIAVEDNKIYVVWSDKTKFNDSGDDFDIFYRYFNGCIWSNIQDISNNFGESINPNLVMKNNKIYVVWEDNTNYNGAGDDYDIFYRCNLSGTNWEDIQVISESVEGQNQNTEISRYPDIAIDERKIYVVWQDKSNFNEAGSDWDIFYRCNISGLNWELIDVISEPIKNRNYNVGISESPKISVENEKIYILWSDVNNTKGAGSDSDIFYRCNISGTYWEDIQVISEPIDGENYNIGSSWSPALDVDDGCIYAVWSDNNKTNGAENDDDIFYLCNITGIDWEPVHVISELSNNDIDDTSNSWFPDIYVENRNIYVVWVDKYNYKNAGMDDDIFYRCNINNNPHWEEIQIISEPEINSNNNIYDSKYPNIIIKNAKSYIVWMDYNDFEGSGFDWDIFYRYLSLKIGLIYPKVSPFEGNTSSNFNFTITYFHFSNIPPNIIIVNLSGYEYSMSEVDSSDTVFMDGKNYYFNIENLNIKTHKFNFFTYDGKYFYSTNIYNYPIVLNTQPKIITNDILFCPEDHYYKVNYNYQDIDESNVNQKIFWNFSTNATWLNFNLITGVLNGTPTNEFVGKYWINISVNDGMDFDFSNFTLMVLNINDPPIITTNNSNIIYEDSSFRVDYNAIDIDTPQKKLIWTMNSNATWLKFDPETAVLNGTPKNENVGQYWINISVNDTFDIDFTNFTLTVINVNDPPEITTEEINIANEDEFFEINFEAIDKDTSISLLKWEINTNAKWIKYNLSNGTINGTPTNDDVGEYWIYISVSDKEYKDYINFTLTVKNVNDPPIIITQDIKKIKVGKAYSVNYEVVDIDPTNDKITWSLTTNAGDWLNIDSITGLLNGNPSNTDVGNYWINVTVNDNNGGLDFHNFTLKVESSKGNLLQKNSSLYWFFLIFIVIVITSIFFVFFHYKRKAEKIPVVRAELIQKVPNHINKTGEILGTNIQHPLFRPSINSNLPTSTTQDQLVISSGNKPELAPSFTYKSLQPQYQLPKTTLSKEQKLGLLQERFLRGEVTEETFKKLKSEIIGNIDEDY